MKNKQRINKPSLVAGMPATKKQLRPETGTKLDEAMEDIRSRAHHVGTVLEGIMQAHPCVSGKSK